MSEASLITENFPPAPVADDAVGISKPKNEDITKTAGYKKAMDDLKYGRVTEYASLKDFYKEMGLSGCARHLLSVFSQSRLRLSLMLSSRW